MTHKLEKIEHFFSFFLLVWLKEYFFLTQCMTQRINWSFFMTQRIEPNDSKNWTFFSKWLKDMTQRIVSIWLEELNPFFWICLNFLRELMNMTQRLDTELNKIWNLNFWKCDSKKPSFSIWTNQTQNWTWLFFSNDSKSLNFFDMTHRIEPFSNMSQEIFFSNWLLNPFFRDSMNWIFSQRIVPSFLNVIQRIETFCWMWKELSHFIELIFLQIWLKIQPFLNLFRLEEFEHFLIWLFFLNVTQRIVIFYKKWVPEWIF